MALENESRCAIFMAMESVSHFIGCSKDVLGGEPVFKGTRVPVQTLFDYLESDHRLEEFLDDFPTVSRERAIGVLEISKQTGPIGRRCSGCG